MLRSTSPRPIGPKMAPNATYTTAPFTGRPFEAARHEAVEEDEEEEDGQVLVHEASLRALFPGRSAGSNSTDHASRQSRLCCFSTLTCDSSGAGVMLPRIAECFTVGSAVRRTVFLASPRATFIALLTLPLVALSSADALAESSVETQTLRVGVFDAPPFSMKNEEGDWEGLSVELWESIARHQGWAYELREYDSLALLLKGVQAGEVDVTPAMASSVAFEVAMRI